MRNPIAKVVVAVLLIILASEAMGCASQKEPDVDTVAAAVDATLAALTDTNPVTEPATVSTPENTVAPTSSATLAPSLIELADGAATTPLDRDLRAFVVTLTDLPSGFYLDDAFFANNQELASGRDDPVSALEEFERVGRVQSYLAGYRGTGLGHAMTTGLIRSQAILCRDTVSAQAYLATIVEDMGEKHRVSADAFGDESYAWMSEQDEFTYLEVFFRAGNVIASVMVAGRLPSMEEALALAGIMEDRISRGEQAFDLSLPDTRFAAETEPLESSVEIDSEEEFVSQLEILSHSSYVQSDRLYIVGEVRNNSDTPMHYVKIVITLYGNDNRIAGTDFTFAMLDVVPAGGKAPFSTSIREWEGTRSYKLQLEGRSGSPPRDDLVVLSHDIYIERDRLYVQGEVENTGTAPARFVKVVITLYDAEGNIVGADFTFTSLETIPPGDTSPFRSSTGRWSEFASYEIQVQGR